MIKVLDFQEQGFEVFLEKLEGKGWLDPFTNTKRGCYVSELAQFYANDLGDLLGVSVEGFDVYVCENKSVLGDERLLELTQRLAQKPNFTKPWSMRKREITRLHHLLFWFAIKNLVPWRMNFC